MNKIVLSLTAMRLHSHFYLPVTINGLQKHSWVCTVIIVKHVLLYNIFYLINSIPKKVEFS